MAVRAVLDDREFVFLATRHHQADVVLLVGPVDADEGCELDGFFLHVISYDRVGIGTCSAQPSEGNMESR